jgi:hypothetical protein
MLIILLPCFSSICFLFSLTHHTNFEIQGISYVNEKKTHIKLEGGPPIKQPNLTLIKLTQLGWFDE